MKALLPILLLALLGLQSAPASAPFSALPTEAEVVGRVDFEALARIPRYADFLEESRRRDPQFPWGAVARMDSFGSAARTAIRGLPSGATSLEFWLIDTLAEHTAGTGGEGAIVVAGSWAADSVAGMLSGRGFLERESNGGRVFIAPDGHGAIALAPDGRIVLGPRVDYVAATLATIAGARPNAASGPMRPYLQSLSGSPVAVSLRQTGETRSALAAMAGAPRGIAREIPGMQGAVASLVDANAAAIALGARDMLIVLDMADAEKAAAGAETLTSFVQMAASLAQFAAIRNPALSRTLQPWAAMRFEQDGARLEARVAVPDESLQVARDRLGL